MLWLRATQRPCRQDLSEQLRASADHPGADHTAANHRRSGYWAADPITSNAANRGADDSSTDARVPATHRLQRDPILHPCVLAMQHVLAL